MFDRASQHEVYQAQTNNLKTLKKAWSVLAKSINAELRNGQMASAGLQTKVLGITYCAYSEVSFSKLVHTPHGFELSEINQIKDVAARDIVQGWNKCLELSLRKINPQSKSGYLPNVRQKLERLISKYIDEPRLLRNKIAHGQWNICLNRSNSARNQVLQVGLDALNIVVLDRWRFVLDNLCQIVENMVESPNKAFHRDYWPLLVEVQNELARREFWTLEAKIGKLKAKRLNARTQQDNAGGTH